MRFARAALACAAVVAVGVAVVSGGSGGDPRTPPALPGLPPPFLGTAVSGDGGLTVEVDAYGDVVDLRAPGPAGEALIDNSSARQAAGTVAADIGIVPRVRIADGPALPLWRSESVRQDYRRGTNVVQTVAWVEGARVVTRAAAVGDSFAMEVLPPRSSVKGRAFAAISVHVEGGVSCAHAERAGQIDLLCRVGRPVPPATEAASRDFFRVCEHVVHQAIGGARRWSRRSRELGAGAPAWAREMYRRSLLTIHALTSRTTGAVAAGARDGWAYVWPRDAATAALALSAAGHRAEARHVTRFLGRLDLAAAARFEEDGAPVPGRAAQGDATGWVTAAALATSLPVPHRQLPWRNRADYQESSPGTYLANALSTTATHVDGPKTGLYGRFSAHQHRAAAEVARVAHEFGTTLGLVREAGDPESGLDSAAGWAVRPFGLRPLYPAAQRTLLRLVEHGTRFGITPGEGWTGGEDPWTAPTAWSAWALAALAAESRHSAETRHPAAADPRPATTAARTGGDGPRPNLHALREGEAHPHLSLSADRRAVPTLAELRHADRRAALELLTDLHRAATPAGDLPERVDVRTGVPTSTTPLLWSSAFAVLAIRELWP